MALLALDASTEMCGVAVASVEPAGVRFLYEKNSLLMRTHSRRLLPMVIEAVDSSGLKPRDIHAISVTAGPGSFTGLRIGLATAKGLAVAWKVPIVSVGTLDAIAMNAPPGSYVCPVLDARREAIYGGLFRVAGDGASIACLVPVGVFDPAVFANTCARAMLRAGVGEAQLLALGDAGGMLVAAAPDALRNEPDFSRIEFIAGREEDRYPRAKNVALLGLLKLEEGGIEAFEAVASYFRRSEAEEKREAGKGE